jgi:predicted glycoside hydrolase/deacetylase ChbG (UPF0249 family)
MPDLARKIIVSADDFGKNSSTHENILELLSLKNLHRVSVMINGTFSAEEIRLLLDSSVKLDLHLNFFNLFESGLYSKEGVGVLGRLLAFSKNYLLGKIKTSAVKKDWTAQLEKFHAIFGKYPDGLNSHEHVHFFPPYFKIISDLAQKSKITYVRFGKKDFLQADNFVSWVIFGLKKINRRRFLSAGLDSTDFLISLDWLKENALRETKNLPCGEIELVIHPEITAELEFLKTHFNPAVSRIF